MAGGCSSGLIVFCNAILGMLGAGVVVAGFWGLSRFSVGMVSMAAVPGSIIMVVAAVGCCAGSRKGTCGSRVAQLVYLCLLLMSGLMLAIMSLVVWEFHAAAGRASDIVEAAPKDVTADQMKTIGGIADIVAELYQKNNCTGGGTSAVMPAEPLPATWEKISCKVDDTQQFFEQMAQLDADKPLEATPFWQCVTNTEASILANPNKEIVPTKSNVQMFCHLEHGFFNYAEKYSGPLAYALLAQLLLTCILVIATIRMLCVPAQRTVGNQPFLQ